MLVYLLFARCSKYSISNIMLCYTARKNYYLHVQFVRTNTHTFIASGKKSTLKLIRISEMQLFCIGIACMHEVTDLHQSFFYFWVLPMKAAPTEKRNQRIFSCHKFHREKAKIESALEFLIEFFEDKIIERPELLINLIFWILTFMIKFDYFGLNFCCFKNRKK